MIHTNDPTPLYKQVKIALKNDILNRVYAPGERIPTEPELRERFGVSRVTVRYAVEELENEGYLRRKQGKGTFVMHEKIESDMKQVSGFYDLVSGVGGAPDRLILSKQVFPANDWLAQHLRMELGKPVLRIERVMSESLQPVMYDMSYYPLARFPGLEERVDHNLSIYGLLKAEYQTVIHRAHKQFNVEIADVAMSRLLKCSPGDPLFSIFKVAYDKGDTPVHLTKNLVMANRVTYVIDVVQDEDEGAFRTRNR